MNPEIDISNVILKTERLLIRPWRQSDLDDFYSYASVDGVGQMAGWKPHESKEESKIILDMFISHKKTFALEYQGKVIGSVGIEKYNETHFPEFKNKKCREIGYVLSKEYWGQGLMPEALKEVIRFLFENANLDVIFCGHFIVNIGIRVPIQKCDNPETTIRIFLTFSFKFFLRGEVAAPEIIRWFTQGYHILFVKFSIIII